jgi:hypothetical protein
MILNQNQKLAIKLFSESKTTVDVVVTLDLPADEVREIYRELWELKGMYRLSEIYEAKYDLHNLLRLHKIVKDLGMEEHDIINVLELADYHQLEHMQWKVEYLRNEIELLEVQKTKCTNDILKLKRMIDEFQSSLPQKGEWYNNTGNLYPAYPEPYINSYSIQLSYNDYRPW